MTNNEMIKDELDKKGFLTQEEYNKPHEIKNVDCIYIPIEMIQDNLYPKEVLSSFYDVVKDGRSIAENNYFVKFKRKGL